ncbi:MAG: ferritin family protein [bacterium]
MGEEKQNIKSQEEEVIRPEATVDDIFRIAIKREAQSHHFYTEAAKWVQTSEARELLLKLAREELEHELNLQRQWEDIKAKRDVWRAMASDM